MSFDACNDAAVFPSKPDWEWVRASSLSGQTLHFNQTFSQIMRRKKFRSAYLAAPYLEYRAGLARAAEDAADWASRFAAKGIEVHSPATEAWLAESTRGPFGVITGPLPDWRNMLRESDIVVVPPMSGWETSIDVWTAVRNAIAVGKPVFLLGKKGKGEMRWPMHRQQ